ncbi:hypothetical protein C1645_818353 [Glomus cerebriforme]|uniref:Uncharacterized protein n=1 Tax=Glomus cerebriforme TaxID=658196 RepID=A0A397T7S2_9GLOM|nr:hypothetical protein C1645_818353 [Glomus cerebriforme]
MIVAFGGSRISLEDDWKEFWIAGTNAESKLRLANRVVSPTILTAIIHGLPIPKSLFIPWFKSVYESVRHIPVLGGTGVAGVTGSIAENILRDKIAALIKILLRVDAKFSLYFNEIELDRHEQQTLEGFIQIEGKTFQNHSNNTVIFILMSNLLNNAKMLECFIEAFKSAAPFKLFKFYFEFDLISEEKENFNYIVYDLLIRNYEKRRIKSISKGGSIIGFDLDLSDYSDIDNYQLQLFNIIKI